MKQQLLNEDCLVMTSPAAWHRDMYREAAPTGNGIIGVSVYGGIMQERIAINHCRLWEKGRKQELPDVHEAFQRTREFIDKGNYMEGNWCSANALKEREYGPRLGNPIPVCDLYYEMQDRKLFKHYKRCIHMDTGVVDVSWEEKDNKYNRSTFVSRADDLVYHKITSSEERFNLEFIAGKHETFEDDVKKKWENKESYSYASGNVFCFEAQHEDDTWYGVIGKIATDGEVMEAALGSSKLLVKNATWVLVVAKTIVGSKVPLKGTMHEVSESLPMDYVAGLEAHQELHEKLYKSVSLSLSDIKDTTNEELLSQAYDGEATPELLEKQWKFGRYLMVCGTREDGLPFPLYGLWHGRYKMMWPHNMANENLEMIYWHTMAGNLSFATKTMIHYYVSKMPQFRECARKLFGLPGIYMPAGTTPEHSLPTQIVPVILNWIGCAGWISQHFYQYYIYTGDEKMLHEEILPFMIEAAEFYENYVQRDKDGRIRIYPSVSPENTPTNFIPKDNPDMAHPCPSVENATMDIAIIKELFTNLMEISKNTGLYQEKREVWQDIIDNLPAYDKTEDGDIREWQKDGFEERYNHRHLSHIYPLFPGLEVVRGRDDEELVKAFEKAVEKRVLGAQTGWSLAHMACIYARLERPDNVMECLDILAKSCLLRNLFTLHNDWRGMGLTLGRGSQAPVQLDAAMGVVGAIQEMLLFVSKDCIKLLPALPDRLNAGEVKGIRFATGSLDMRWNRKQGEFEAELYAERNTRVQIILPEYIRNNCSVKSGEIIEIAAGQSICIKNGDR